MVTIFLNRQNKIEWGKEAPKGAETPDDRETGNGNTDNDDTESLLEDAKEVLEDNPLEDLGYCVEILRGERST